MVMVMIRVFGGGGDKNIGGVGGGDNTICGDGDDKTIGGGKW